MSNNSVAMQKEEKIFTKSDLSKGILFVLSAPSGAGKSTLCAEIIKKFPSVKLSVSYTTRAKRAGEIDGKDYIFISKEKFKAMINDNAFAEWADVHGQLYGTPLRDIKKAEDEGIDLILDIDWQGAKKIKQRLEDAVYIFLLPPSLNELEKRIRLRAKDSKESIQRRLSNAKEEMSHAHWYDYNVLNEKIDDAVASFSSIIIAESYRTPHLKNQD